MIGRINKKRAVEEDVIKITDLPLKARKILEKKQKIEQDIEDKKEKERIASLEMMRD